MSGEFERTGTFRATFLCGALLVLLAGLSVRLAHIQLFQAEAHASGARKQQVRRRAIPAARGRILDRNGHPLALSVTARSLHADPGEVDDVESAAARTAPLLGIPVGELVSRLRRPGRFVWLHRRIENRDLLRRVAELDLPWIGLTDEPARHYPAGRMAAHLVGFVGVDEQGLWGIEGLLDRRLRPTEGYRLVERDGLRGGVPIAGLLAGERKPRAGEDVRLTLDLRIQTFAEKAMDALVEEWEPEGAVAVVMDPRTGDVLASVVRPDFDPRRYGDVGKDVWQNKVLTSCFPPGSSFKPLVAAIAVDAGVLDPERDTIDCEGGRWKLPGMRTVVDHEAMGRVPFADVLIHSSNIGMVKIGQEMGCEALHDALIRMGFRRPTGCGLPGESAGMMAPLRDWRSTEHLRCISIGQQISVSPLQLARAFSALATDGRAPRPRFVLDGREPERTRVMSARAAAAIRPILGRVVEEGTGKPVRLKLWRVGGKTGTADRILDDVKVGYVSVFVGLAPISDPRFVVVVMADRSRTDRGTPYGSRVAAPAVRRILESSLRLYGVTPDAD
jgi:cell division protein FtsI/penicillin-binding protein 2